MNTTYDKVMCLLTDMASHAQSTSGTGPTRKQIAAARSLADQELGSVNGSMHKSRYAGAEHT
ncbi:hypothetical protein J4E08_05625 [Sagittula sp. NFXS13]|uniref:hypothetical protein n=1 Tax=Sagittula sp. NFXS13 TaxID=2819095 RepID=UPI0032DE645F